MAENQGRKSFLQGEELRKAIGTIELDLGLMAHGIDYLIDNGAPERFIEKYTRSYDKALARKAAELLHLEESALADPATRTEEQKRLMLELAGAHQSEQIHRYLQSDFVKTQVVIDNKALSILQRQRYGEPKKAEPTEDEKKLAEGSPELEAALEQKTEPLPRFGFDDLPGDEGTELQEALRLLNLSFYASHPEFKPKEAGFIGEPELALVQAATEAYLAFHQASGKPYSESIWDYFKPEERRQITEISQSDFFNEPTSKAWRMQNAIALSGAAGFDLNVGKKTEAGKVIIEASISDLQGNPVNIDDMLKGVQRAIGNLIDRNGGIRPIVVTPAQIYRAYAGLPVDSFVSPAQEADMEAAMDKLMFYPSSLNFKTQLERHKHIKQQDDYDYQEEGSGKIKRNLVPAQKLENAVYRGINLPVAYEIYDYPSFYQYSHIIGQMARVPNRLLAGAAKPAIKADKTPGLQGSARNIAVKENILGRILRMEEREEHKKAFTNVIKVEDVAADCGIELTDKTRRTLLKNIGLYLEELRQEGKIKKAVEKKEARKIIGFTISI